MLLARFAFDGCLVEALSLLSLLVIRVVLLLLLLVLAQPLLLLLFAVSALCPADLCPAVFTRLCDDVYGDRRCCGLQRLQRRGAGVGCRGP